MEKKSLTTGMLLTLLFGPLGMIYTSFVGFITFIPINIFFGILYSFASPEGGKFILVFFGFVITVLQLYWTYNVITETNDRISIGNPPMTQIEEFNVGFKNVCDAILDLLGCILFTCCVFAVLSVIHILDNTENSTQGFIFFSVLVLFLLVFWFANKRQGVNKGSQVKS